MTNIEWNPILHVLRRGAAIAIILFVLFGVFPSLYFVRDYPGDPFLVSRMQNSYEKYGYLGIEIATVTWFWSIMFRLFLIYPVYIIISISVFMLPQTRKSKIVCVLLLVLLPILLIIAERRIHILWHMINF